MRLNITLLSLIILLAFSWSATAQNYALQMDGTDNKVGILDSEELNPTDALTVEAWIKAYEWPSSVWAGVILGKQGTNPDKGYCFTGGENGKVEFTVSLDEAWSAVATPAILGTDAWYHVAGVYDGTTMKIYVNGILQNTTDVTGTFTPGTGVVMNLGDNPTWPGRFWNGVIDEVRIWNVARTGQEIQDNLATELTGTETGLVAYYPMNEGEGDTIADLTGNENTGQLINMVAEDWVTGFEPTTSDVGVLGIASPSAVGSGFTGTEAVKVEVKNFANSPISTFDVSYVVNGGDTVTETVNTEIAAFETYIYAFGGTIDLSGVSEVEITAFTTLDGDSNMENDTVTEVISPSLNILVFDETRHNYGSYGQTQNRTIYMPENLDAYSQVLMHADLTCPSGGCDPWDQPAKISINKNAESWELARYITPYGIACGDWTWDISDFRELLTEKVEWESYIQVWGSSGWLLTLELEFIEGEMPYDAAHISKLWCTDNWVYGDPEVSYDFDEMVVPIGANTNAAKIRMTMTGHGQGNTDNAAEFSEFTHHIHVDGVETFEQHLWKADCNANSCSPQNGTWQYSRAGWCPGQDVQPWEWDMEGHFTPGVPVALDFVLADYTNLLNTGYNSGSHTEPHYRCHSYFVQYEGANNGTEDVFTATSQFSGYPNPTSGTFTVVGKVEPLKEISVYSIDGKLLHTYPVNLQEQFSIDLSVYSYGIYMIQAKSENHVGTIRAIVQGK